MAENICSFTVLPEVQSFSFQEQLKQNINKRNMIVSLSQTNSNVSGTTTTTYI